MDHTCTLHRPNVGLLSIHVRLAAVMGVENYVRLWCVFSVSDQTTEFFVLLVKLQVCWLFSYSLVWIIFIFRSLTEWTFSYFSVVDVVVMDTGLDAIISLLFTVPYWMWLFVFRLLFLLSCLSMTFDRYLRSTSKSRVMSMTHFAKIGAKTIVVKDAFMFFYFSIKHVLCFFILCMFFIYFKNIYKLLTWPKEL